MSDKYILTRGGQALAELPSFSEAEEMKRFMRRWHPGNAYAVRVEEAE